MARGPNKFDTENLSDPSIIRTGRDHKATYARDKRKGGYLVRVEGPHAAKFCRRIVPVTTRDENEHDETLDTLLWSGIDPESGANVALYTFKAKPRADLDDDIPF